MEYKEDKIVEEIIESLQNYELPYEEGAWESFREKHEKKEGFSQRPLRPWNVLWKLTAVAAMIALLLVYSPWFYSGNSKKSVKEKLVKTVLVPNKRNLQIGKRIKKEKPKREESGLFKETDILIEGDNKENSRAENQKDDYSALATIEEKDLDKVPEKLLSDTNNSVQLNATPDVPLERIASLSNKENVSHVPNENRWKFGIEIASSFSSDRMNFGGGVFTELKISNKISLGMGVAFTKIGASNDLGPIGVSSSTRKVGVESAMQAIDIPLSIVYQVNESFYASLGISSFTVLNENKTYQYETDIVSESFVTDPKTGLASTEYSVVTKEFSEPSKESHLKGNSNLGYLNFSVGKKQNFYGESQLLFEPFLKIPLGNLSNEEVKLMNAGLKLKLIF